MDGILFKEFQVIIAMTSPILVEVPMGCSSLLALGRVTNEDQIRENHLNHHRPLRALLAGSFAQFEVPVPYNPDGNADGFIALPDLLDFLMLYGSEYSPEALATDSSSAIIHMGQGDYFDCASWCASLEGNWKVMDEILVGRYKDQIQTMTSNNATWMDRRSNNGLSYQYVPTLQPDNWSVAQSTFNSDRECICQTRVIQPIVIQSGPCDGIVDLCGICDGPGPVYECGCFEIQKARATAKAINSMPLEYAVVTASVISTETVFATTQETVLVMAWTS